MVFLLRGSGIWKGPKQLLGKLPKALARHQVTVRPWAKPCPVCSSMKSEELAVGHLLCVKSKMPGIHFPGILSESSPHSGNPDPCLTRDLVVLLERKGHEQVLPWHLGREGLIYSVQVQELALLAKRLYHLSGTGSELMGPSPVFPAVQFLTYSREWQQMWQPCGAFSPCQVCC